MCETFNQNGVSHAYFLFILVILHGLSLQRRKDSCFRAVVAYSNQRLVRLRGNKLISVSCSLYHDGHHGFDVVVHISRWQFGKHRTQSQTRILGHLRPKGVDSLDYIFKDLCRQGAGVDEQIFVEHHSAFNDVASFESF